MTQRINLYRDDLRPRERSGELQRNLAIAGAALLAMLVWGGIAQWRDSSSASALARLTEEQAALQSEMTAATARLAERRPDAALTAALVEAQFAVDGRRWLSSELARAGNEAAAFSEVLGGLGRQRPAPLWLTRIHVADAGAALGLSGRTLDPAAVPSYLEALGGEAALAGREFTHFRIGRDEDAPAGPLDFDMATDCAVLAEGCDPRPVPEVRP
jgi:MSHA biogenesis protein MshI